MLVVCLLQEGSNKNQSQTFGQGHGAMNDLITAHEIVCYEVNAVHYLNRSEGTHMARMNHAPPNAACRTPPRVLSSVALRTRTVFLGRGRKGSAAVTLERATDCKKL